MKFAYLRAGAPLVTWNGRTAPTQSRAADTVALGSLGGSTLDGPTLILPKPGAPEPILGGMGGCSCSGSCGCGTGAPLSGLAESVPGGYLTIGIAAFIAWRMLRKRGR